jgi:signal transduction histidine kinase
VGVDVHVSGEEDASRPAVALVWRVAQEAVRNVARHAGATRMSLTMRRQDESLVLEVVDDGRGFVPGGGPADDRFGLRAAHSLVREHGGTMEVESTPGSGTTVRMEVPLG